MSDSEFLSFLYSERDRENDISQFQGWNEWALIGAIVATLCAAYGALRAKQDIDWMNVLFYSSGSIAFFLAYHTWLVFLKRDRGSDFSRVRLLKEKAPWADAVLALITATSAVVFISIYDELTLLFWSWVVMLVLQISAIVCAMVNGNRLVPFYFIRPYFTKLKFNVAFDGLYGGLFCLVWQESFKRASWNIISTEFEIGICIAAIIVLVYFLIRSNTENKVVRQFDAIIDRYLYSGASREDTFKTILCNRMGYGVIEVCQKELDIVQARINDCWQKKKELIEIKTKIQEGDYELPHLTLFIKQAKQVLKSMQDSLRHSEKLTTRLNEIVKMAPVLNQVDDITLIFDANKLLHEVVLNVNKEIDAVSSLVDNEMKRYYCRRANSLCPQLDCEHRNDPPDRKYAKHQRWRLFFGKLNK